jgi:hypothetical protein
MGSQVAGKTLGVVGLGRGRVSLNRKRRVGKQGGHSELHDGAQHGASHQAMFIQFFGFHGPARLAVAMHGRIGRSV